MSKEIIFLIGGIFIGWLMRWYRDYLIIRDMDKQISSLREELKKRQTPKV